MLHQKSAVPIHKAYDFEQLLKRNVFWETMLQLPIYMYVNINFL
jgi:hypothetical protein